MSDFQMWSEQPALWWLSAMMGIVLAMLFYGTFPIVFSKTRTSGITKGRYRWYCIGAAVGVYAVLTILYSAMGIEEIPDMIPAVFWTGVFYKAGLSSLKKRGNLLPSAPRETAQLIKEPESASVPQSALTAEQGDTREPQPSAASRKPEKVLDKTAEASRTTGGGPVRFCRNCGCQLVPGSKFCGICGTKVVREW